MIKIVCPKCGHVLVSAKGEVMFLVGPGASLKCASCNVEGVRLDEDD